MNRDAFEPMPPPPPPLPRTIVTGATSGIGRALALRLVDAGVPVVAIGRDQRRLQALAERSDGIAPYAADLRDIDRLPALAARIVADHPDVGALVNNAGVQHDVRVVDGDAEAIRAEIDVNLVAPLTFTYALLPHLLRRPSSCVVNVTSSLAYAPKRTAAVYSATKAGLQRYTQALRLQVAGTPVRVVEVVLPLVDTPMTAGRGRGKLSADEAAHSIVAGLVSGTPDIHVGMARWVPVLQRWAPGLLARILQRG